LKQAKEEGHSKEGAPTDAAQDDATGDGYGKAVHCQADG
jgi:hypothetical protein